MNDNLPINNQNIDDNVGEREEPKEGEENLENNDA